MISKPSYYRDVLIFDRYRLPLAVPRPLLLLLLLLIDTVTGYLINQRLAEGCVG